MTYKAFQEWYHEASIKHLLLHEYQGNLVSPPFATEKCKDYSKLLIWNKNQHIWLDLNLPPVTSKTNAIVEANDSLWLIPYGIYDNFSTVVEIRNTDIIYHSTEKRGKGQFYSAASDGQRVFSFPLGYEETSYGIFIENRTVKSIKFDKQKHIKLHMGCVYSNGRFWSMPRGDTSGYSNLVAFDGKTFKKFTIPEIDKNITRKFTDLIAVNDILYALPFGETAGLNHIIEFDTNSEKFSLYKIPKKDFAKKYNAAVLVKNKIIGLPYGDEHCNDSNLGIIFDIKTKEIVQFDIGIMHGGKYRYRSGVNYCNHAYFFPAGTPSCPIIKVDTQGNILKRLFLENIMVGRPVVYQEKIYVMCYCIDTQDHKIMSFDSDLNHTTEFVL
jgi:hypothetical protein